MNIYNRTILIGIINKKQNKKKCLNNLEELEKLIITLKGKVIKKFYQRIRKINLKTYIGKGKIKTIKKFIIKKKIKTIIFNDKISSIQYRNIENFINKNNIFIYDRTKIILDIFKYRSKNYNSKIQIELAEKKYLFTRLNKMWKHLKKPKGKMYIKGTGEKILEIDKRNLNKRIYFLKKKIKKIKKQIKTQSKNRKYIKKISIIGYTNSGKSTLINSLLNNNINIVKNKLFSTINTNTQKIYINNKTILISDTVGFINNIPKELYNSFYTTLKIIKYSNLIINVIDLSSKFIKNYFNIIKNIFIYLKIKKNKNIINIFNKKDISIYTKKKIKNIINKYNVKNYLITSIKKKKNIKKILKLIKSKI